MKVASKSLGEFIADVLSTVSSATYMPASLIVGVVTLIGRFRIDPELTPFAALRQSGSPTWTEIAVFVVATGILAAVIDPLQFFVTRLMEGHIGSRPTRLSSQRATWADLHARRDKLVQQSAGLGRDSDLGFDTRQEVVMLSRQLQKLPASKGRVTSTSLGNLIRAYEDQANEVLRKSNNLPAEIPPSIQQALPALYFAVPPETRAQHDRFRSQLTMLCTMVLVVPLTATAASVSVFAHPLWAAAFATSGALLTLLAYSGARSAGDGYGTMLLAIARQVSAGRVTMEATATSGTAAAGGHAVAS